MHKPAAAQLDWTRSSFTGAQGNCFELAVDGSEILVRNSNRPNDGVIGFTVAEMDAFMAGIRAGEFDALVDQARAGG